MNITPAPDFDIGNLAERKSNIRNDLKTALQNLKNALGRNDDEEIIKALVSCANFGIPSAFPKFSSPADDQSIKLLQKQATDIYAHGISIIAAIDKNVIKSKQDNYENAKLLIETIQLVFGRSFNVLPRFHFKSQDSDDVDRSELISTAQEKESNIFSSIIGSPPVTSREGVIQHWVNEVGQVRSKIENFEWVRTFYNAFQNAELGLNILQLPYQEDDSWMGVEFPEDMKLRKAKLSMLVHYQDKVQTNWTGDFCGLLLDEWVEEIPGKSETTGITFQYDQPNSQPPQTLLLAISPGDGGNWDWDKLTGILNDTLNRAKKRAVDTTLVNTTDWASLLPAVISEFSNTKANVSLFFRDNLS